MGGAKGGVQASHVFVVVCGMTWSYILYCTLNTTRIAPVLHETWVFFFRPLGPLERWRWRMRLCIPAQIHDIIGWPQHGHTLTWRVGHPYASVCIYIHKIFPATGSPIQDFCNYTTIISDFSCTSEGS